MLPGQKCHKVPSALSLGEVSHAIIKNLHVCLGVSLSIKCVFNMGLDDRHGKSRAWKLPESPLLPGLSLGLLLGRLAVGLFSHAQDVEGKSCKVMEVMQTSFLLTDMEGTSRLKGLVWCLELGFPAAVYREQPRGRPRGQGGHWAGRAGLTQEGGGDGCQGEDVGRTSVGTSVLVLPVFAPCLRRLSLFVPVLLVRN